VTDLSATIAALRELRADLVSLRPMWLTHLKAIDEAVEGLEGQVNTPASTETEADGAFLSQPYRLWPRAELAVRAHELETKLATAVEGLEEARKVIGPFAAGAENWDDPMYSADMTESGKDIPWPDDTPLYEPTVEYITVGDLRAARAFLAKHGASSDD
jgi:hypothetical protein